MKLIVKEASKGSLTLVPGGKADEPEIDYTNAEEEYGGNYPWDPNPWDQEGPGVQKNPSLDMIQSPVPGEELPKKNHLKLVVKERKNS